MIATLQGHNLRLFSHRPPHHLSEVLYIPCLVIKKGGFAVESLTTMFTPIQLQRILRGHVPQVLQRPLPEQHEHTLRVSDTLSMGTSRDLGLWHTLALYLLVYFA